MNENQDAAVPRTLELVVTAEDDLVVTSAAAKALARIVRARLDSGPSAA